MTKKTTVEVPKHEVIYFLHTFSNEPVGEVGDVIFEYDYIRVPGKLTNIKIDVELLLPVYGDIMVRYHYPYKQLNNILPSGAYFYSRLKYAYNNTIKTFNKWCSDNQIPAPKEVLCTDEVIRENAVVLSRELALNFTMEQQPANQDMNLLIFELPKQQDCINFLYTTFLIIDALTMLNTRFDRLNNREMMLRHMQLSFSRYTTLRMDAMSQMDRKGKAAFTAAQTGYLFALADCAVQVLLSPMIDIICHDLEKFGIKKQDTNSYIELVTYFRQGLNKNMAETGSSINILNQYIDWSSLIR